MLLTCPKCRSPFDADPARADLRCPECGADVLLPSSEDRTLSIATAGIPDEHDAETQALPRGEATLTWSPGHEAETESLPRGDVTMNWDASQDEDAAPRAKKPQAPERDSKMAATLGMGSIDDALPDVETNLWAAASSTSGSQQSVSRVRLNERQKEELKIARFLLEKGVLPLEKVNEYLSAARKQSKRFHEHLASQKIVPEQSMAKILEEISTKDAAPGMTEVFGSHFTLVRDGDDVYIHDRRQIRRFGKYEILGEIARGGMGVVYRARQVGLDRVIALKVLLASGTFNLESILRFQREARTTANLAHPGIVPIYDVGEVEGEHYFTMEYVSGGSLSGLMKKERLTPKRALEVMKTIAEAIDHAHEQGVIHRDLKPGNILFDKAGNPKVTDFGLAKEVEVESELTHSGQMLGTPAYMAPEQALGEHASVDRQSDVYALGAMLYEMLTGKKSFEGDNIPQLLFEIVTSDPVPPRKIDPQIHPDLEVITLKAMSKDKWMRYLTAREFASDIQNFLEGRAVSAEAPGRVYLFKRWVKRHKALAAVIAASVVGMTLLGSVLGWGLYQESQAVAKLEREKVENYQRRLDAKPFYDRGTGFENNGQLDRAVDAFEKAVETDPTFDTAYIALASVLRKKGRTAEALAGYGKAIEAAPTTYAGYNERASLLRDLGRLDEALRDYDHLLGLDAEKKSAEILYNRSIVHKLAKRPAAAKADLEAVLAIRPDFVAAHDQLGQIAFDEGNLEQALRHYERTLQIDPDHVNARYQLARVLLQLGRAEESLPHFDRLIEGDGDSAGPDLSRIVLLRALSRRGIARYGAGRVDDAVRDFERVDALLAGELPTDVRDREVALGAKRTHVLALLDLERAEAAVEVARGLLAAIPGETTPRVLLVEALLLSGRIGTATEEAIPLARAELDAAGHVTLARLSLAVGQPDQAADHSTKAAAADPESVEAKLLGAMALVQGDRAEAAEPTLAEVEKSSAALALKEYLAFVRNLGPNRVRAQTYWADRARRAGPQSLRALEVFFDCANRLRLLDRKGDVTQEVAEAAQALLDRSAGSAAALQILAGRAQATGDPARALEFIDRAIAAVPGEAISYVLRARIYRALGRDIDSLEDLGTARNLGPDRTDVLLEEGAVLYDMEATDDARKRFDRIIELDARHPAALFFRALCRAKAGDEPGSLADLDLSIEAVDDADARFNRAVLRIKAGRKAEAAEDLRKVLELSPEYPRAREILERLPQ